MKYLLENGHKNFRFGLLKNAHGITAATKFSGPPDPLHGNVPYLMVRKAAQELSEVLFDTEMFEASQEGKPNRQTNTGSLGSSGSQTGKYEGFGNAPAAQKKSFGDSVIDNMYKMAEKMSEQPADHQRELLKSVQSVGGYKPPTNYVAENHPLVVPFTKPELKSQPVEPVRKHVPGKAGGGWGDSDEDDDSYHSLSKSSSKRSTESNNLLDRMEGVTLEDWSGEENLVTSTVDNGQSFLLKRTEIKNFIQRCHQLGCYKILELLNQRLKSGVDNHTMRSLLLVENLLTTDLIGVDRIIQTCKENLIWLVGNCSGPIASKANKIIKILEKLSNGSLLHGGLTNTSIDTQNTGCSTLGQGQHEHMLETQLSKENEEQVNINTGRDIELLLQPDPSANLYMPHSEGQRDAVQTNTDVT
ncbi:AP-4 complex accessory subunit Tepsin-like isoform X2 [Mizuhopecten yessoensis]|nr:AP-4 complex accessory subunit Tepsin-like isoform X2 [Mizuhopecten yessoensis]